MLSSLSFPTCIMGVHIVWLEGALKNLTGSGDELFFRSAGKRLGGAGQEGKWAGSRGRLARTGALLSFPAWGPQT